MSNKKRILVVVVIAMISSVLLSCGLQHRTVGKKYNTENWCKFSSGKHVAIKDNVFLYEFTITKTENDQEYLLEGTIDGLKGTLKSIGRLVPNKSKLYLILAKDDLVVHAVSFFPIGTDVLQKLPFKKVFKSTPFDSFTITGKVMARG